MTWYAMHPLTGIVASRSTKGGVVSALADAAEVDGVLRGTRVRPGLYTTEVDGETYTIGTREELGDVWAWAFEGRTSPALHESDGFELVDAGELVVGDVVRMAGRLAEPIVRFEEPTPVPSGDRVFRTVIVLDDEVERILFLRGPVLARLDGERAPTETARQEPEEIEVREWAEPHPEKHDPDEGNPPTHLRSLALLLAYDDTPRAEWEARRRELLAELEGGSK